MGASTERSEVRGQLLDGRYRIGHAIGTGGTGIVFEAERLATLERVVVKMLRPGFAGNPDLMSLLAHQAQEKRRISRYSMLCRAEERAARAFVSNALGRKKGRDINANPEARPRLYADGRSGCWPEGDKQNQSLWSEATTRSRGPD